MKTSKGPYFVIATVMWEFFSYFGMRALLILYLTQALLFSDQHAYALYGAYISLIFVTPIIGGWIADRFLGYRWAVVIGCVLIILGHISLWLDGVLGLYLGLSLLVLGVGFFKTNAICLISACYDKNDPNRGSAYSLYYVGGNLGATIAPIICAYMVKQFGWHAGFAAAGLGMTMGLATMFLGWKYLKQVSMPKKNIFINNRVKASFILKFVLGLLLAFGMLWLVLQNLWAGYVLTVISIIAIVWMLFVYFKNKKDIRRGLLMAFVLTLFATIFWAFDQQGGCSISLFILRNVNRQIFGGSIPAAMFQSVNPGVILIAGPLIALLWKILSRYNINWSAIIKLLIGMLMLTGGFVLITFGAKLAQATGQSSMNWVIFGLMLIGMAELFIDPVVLTLISKVSPEKSLGGLTGIYYLFVGAIANYMAAAIARFSSVNTKAVKEIGSVMSAKLYTGLFFQVVVAGVILSVLLLSWWWAKFFLVKPTCKWCEVAPNSR